MDRISRSFRLVRQLYRILMQDSELMFLPFTAGVITLTAGLGDHLCVWGFPTVGG